MQAHDDITIDASHMKIKISRKITRHGNRTPCYMHIDPIACPETAKEKTCPQRMLRMFASQDTKILRRPLLGNKLEL
jgi:hypothetical protein